MKESVLAERKEEISSATTDLDTNHNHNNQAMESKIDTEMEMAMEENAIYNLQQRKSKPVSSSECLLYQ